MLQLSQQAIFILRITQIEPLALSIKPSNALQFTRTICVTMPPLDAPICVHMPSGIKVNCVSYIHAWGS